MPRPLRYLAPLLLAAVTGCGDYVRPTAPLRPGELPPSLGISDGLHSLGNKGFFFLPPLVRDPSGDPEFGDSPFKANAAPHAQICLLNPSPDLSTATCSNTLVKTFSAVEINVSTTDQYYHVNWNTDETILETGAYYRATVFVGTQTLGFVDIQPVTSTKDLRNPKTGDVIPLVEGRTLPIKFRIEDEAVCEFQGDCVKKRIRDDVSNVVSTPSGDGNLIFTPAFLPDGIDEIEVTIQRIALNESEKCHAGSGAEQILFKTFGHCYEVTTIPSLFDGVGEEGLQADVTWVQCFSDVPADEKNLVQIFKSDPPARGGLKALREVQTPQGFCVEPDAGPAPGSSAMLWRLDRLSRQVAGLFLPKIAYAIDLGLGGLIGAGDGFSRFQRAIAASIEASGGTDFRVPVNGTIDVAVLVTADAHAHPPGGGEPTHTHPPLANVPVQFSLFDSNNQPVGGPVNAVSGRDGLATGSFPAGTEVATYTVRATAGASGSPITFNVTVGVPHVLIYGPSMAAATFGRHNEQTLAEAAGLMVTVKSATEWATMTGSQFAQYSAIVFGDPNCLTTTTHLAAADGNKAVWSPVITGPIAINGTDPILHQDPEHHPQALPLVTNSIKYAASVPGKTGLYVSLSCYYPFTAPGTAVTFLSGIGTFLVTGQGICPDQVTIVPRTSVHPVMDGLTSEGLSNWGCSVHEFFSSMSAFPSNFEVLATAFREASNEHLPYIIARGPLGTP